MLRRVSIEATELKGFFNPRCAVCGLCFAMESTLCCGRHIIHLNNCFKEKWGCLGIVGFGGEYCKERVRTLLSNFWSKIRQKAVRCRNDCVT